MQKSARFGAFLLAAGLACGKGQSSGNGNGGPPPPPPAQAFTLTVAVHGNGTVTSSPAGIDCGTACTMSFAAGTVVTLTASASAGRAALPQWTGACNGAGSCSVTMTADAAVAVEFVDTQPVKGPPQHTLTVSVTGSGTVTSAPGGINCGTTCSAPFDEGAHVTLAAQPAPGFTLSAFSGACSGTSCTVRMSADQSVTATFAAVPGADECAGLLPSALPAAIKAALPDNECRDATSDDGDGTFVLGYTAGEGPTTFPEHLFFSIRNGQAVRIGDRILGGDETNTYVYSQPSGFTVFERFGIDQSSSLSSFDHGGNSSSRVPLAQGNFDHSPTSDAGVDPSGGTATVKHVFDSASGTRKTFYKRFDKTGAPETGDVLIDDSDRPVLAVGVALSGHALVIAQQSAAQSVGRWIARDGTPLTDWFALPAPLPHSFTQTVIRFLTDGSVAVGSHSNSQTVNYSDVTYQFVVQDGQTAASALPAWLQSRSNDIFYVARGGRAYVAWGAQGSCGAGAVEVLAASSGKSCGCLTVPFLAGNTSVGRDGSLMVGEPSVNFGTCVWDLYPHLFQ